MKQLIRLTLPLFATFMLALIQAVVFAQETSGNNASPGTSRTTTNTSGWYASPWIWVTGGAVLLVILTAFVRSKNSNSATGDTDQVTGSKRTETDV